MVRRTSVIAVLVLLAFCGAANARTREFTVPKLAGDTLAQARKDLGANHLKVGKVTDPKASKGETLVVGAESPKAGRRVKRGTKVKLTLKVKPTKATTVSLPTTTTTTPTTTTTTTSSTTTTPVTTTAPAATTTTATATAVAESTCSTEFDFALLGTPAGGNTCYTLSASTVVAADDSTVPGAPATLTMNDTDCSATCDSTFPFRLSPPATVFVGDGVLFATASDTAGWTNGQTIETFGLQPYTVTATYADSTAYLGSTSASVTLTP